MKEEIRVIPWTNGRYGVSNLGNVYSFYNTHGVRREIPLLLKGGSTREGYKMVCLMIDKKRVGYLIHRLVAELFIPNSCNLPQVNHINENKLDNRVENLEWCTASYNCRYGKRNDCRKKKLVQVCYGKTKTFDSLTDASIYFCCSKRIIRNMLLGNSENKYNIHYA